MLVTSSHYLLWVLSLQNWLKRGTISGQTLPKQDPTAANPKGDQATAISSFAELKDEAISEVRRTRAVQRELWALRDDAKSRGDLATGRRAKVILGYIEGKSVISLAETLDVTRGAINRWLQWYEAEGIEGLRTLPRPGRAPKLGEAQQQELITLIEAGPQSAGHSAGMANSRNRRRSS